MLLRTKREPMLVRVSLTHMPEGFPEKIRAAMPEDGLRSPSSDGVQAPARHPLADRDAAHRLGVAPGPWLTVTRLHQPHSACREFGSQGPGLHPHDRLGPGGRRPELGWEATADVLCGFSAARLERRITRGDGRSHRGTLTGRYVRRGRS